MQFPLRHAARQLPAWLIFDVSQKMEDEPSIAFGPLKIWVHGRQFPDADDYWDANWLSVTARCEGSGSRVQVTESFLHLGELKQWKSEVEAFQRELSGVVELPTMEPTLKIRFEGSGSANGHFACRIDLTGDHVSEVHRFLFQADQSYLPGLLAQLAVVLREHPVRNEGKG